MVKYIISETFDGRFIVQTPNGLGGLYPLVTHEDDCRNTVTCFAAIATHALNSGSLFEGVEIEMRPQNHPDNRFTHA